jgi:hypothetical protein
MVVIMAKAVMRKALAVEFASDPAMAALGDMVSGKASTHAATAAKAAGMAATTHAATMAAASHAPATAAKATSAATTPTTAASKRIAGNACTGQRQRGNEGHNLTQTKRLHRRLPFSSICWVGHPSTDRRESKVRWVRYRCR